MEADEATKDYHTRGKWLINAGIKTDFTTKHYPYWQQVVNILKDRIKLIQIGSSKEHIHMPLEYCENWLDKTNHQELIKAVYHCRGVICPETYVAHLAAAFGKPCVTVAGGRIPQSWTAYPKQTFLHSLGCLPCSQIPCWRSRVMPLNDGDDASLCSMPVSEKAAKCMDMISPLIVACAVLKYEGWTLDGI